LGAQVHTNRKRAQTKAVNQARKEQEGAGGITGQQDASQPPANADFAATSAAAAGASQPSMTFAEQLPMGAMASNARGAASHFPASQPQQQHGSVMLPPPGFVANTVQQEHSDSGAAPAFLQVAAPVTAPYLVPLPHSAAFSVPLPQSAPHAMVPPAQPHPTLLYRAPTAQSVSFAMQSAPHLAHPPQQQQPQQPPVLNLQPAPGQSIAEATIAAIQAQQVAVALLTL
jgi:hypothetical protein